MKLIIQIPCLNEENTLAKTVNELPKKIEGISEIEYLVIDDGSKDSTVNVARKCGVHHILSLGSNRGLATAFKRGIAYALKEGADIIVNTDADNQYYGPDIAKLVKPIIEQKADLVVGSRPIADHPEFHPLKKLLQFLGSWTLRRISKTKVRDAASGFRAFSREACQRIFIHSKFSYCMETLIQAGNSGIRVESVDINVNPKVRESRLFKSIPEYISKSCLTMISMFLLYRPGAFFSCAGSIFFTISLFLGIRFIYFIYILGELTLKTNRTYIPSLILLSICAIIGIIMFTLAIFGEIMKSQRTISEEILYQIRKQDTSLN